MANSDSTPTIKPVNYNYSKSERVLTFPIYGQDEAKILLVSKERAETIRKMVTARSAERARSTF